MHILDIVLLINVYFKLYELNEGLGDIINQEVKDMRNIFIYSKVRNG